MLTYETDFQNFLKKLRSKDNESFKELFKYCNGYIIKKYNEKIGRFYGNKYWNDYVSEVSLSIFTATLNFNGNNSRNYKSYIYETILNCVRKTLRNNSKSQIVIKYLDDENDLAYIEKNVTCKENNVLNETLFNKELMHYLNRKLNPLEIQLFKSTYYKKETLKYFAETHNLNYSSIRSISRRMCKKIDYKKIKSLLELKHSFFLFMACIIGGCL
ncbi:sigma-70 family RNA polymerase sigma factor [Clostridium sp. P21]|uniref:Sigma-70 family RNA polymerase sigma factor n=1 Tax=Clostridium muellerianum TaxID=2716538 RepID=A0A7Y0HNJ0_9CLOT|nr:sigma-70 family RNA polymerase sigma factor [Clostridium muellerianum]NMM61653.1 sigma-70 family RNA polymerase sigma factor [Clostridium muellerianum]